MSNITAVIPIRKGSQRVKDKNVKPFSGSTLLEKKIDIIKQLPLNNIIINTDCPIAIDIAKKNDIEVFRREHYYASSECTGSEFHEYIAKVTNSESILLAHVTEPLVTVKSYLECIDIFKNNDYDSIISVEVVKKFLWFQNKPINYELRNAPSSQNLPEYLSPTFGISLAKRDAILETKHIICNRPYFYKLDEIEAIDVDTELDFEFAEFLFNKFRR